MMTVFGMMFERHGREFPVVNGASLRRSSPGRQPSRSLQQRPSLR
jgi:hypothetical protein